METFENGITRITKPFSGKIFWGYALIRESRTLEVMSFDFSDKNISGIGSLLMFKINEYKKLSRFFPGIDFGFDSSTKPVIFQALLSGVSSIDKTDPLVKTYFTETVNYLRMECPDLSDTEKLRELFDVSIKKPG